jgi:transposase
MMVALLGQQKLLEQKDQALDKKSTELKNPQALINVLEGKLRLMNQRKFGASSEKNLSQKDWIADEVETLADGEPDADNGEIEPEPELQNKPKKPRLRKGLSDSLPRIQKYLRLSDEERQGAIETFFVKIKEELDIIPAQVQVIEIMQERWCIRMSMASAVLRLLRVPHIQSVKALPRLIC